MTREVFDGLGDRFPIVRDECAEVDKIDRYPLLFEAFRGLIRSFYKGSKRNDRNVIAFADLSRLAERNEEFARWILRFVIDLTIEMFMLEEHYGIVAAYRGSKQSVSVECRRRVDDPQSRSVSKKRRARL